MNDKDRSTAPHRDTSASPYGPQPDQIDQAAGGADSSPFDNLSSDERQKKLADPSSAPESGTVRDDTSGNAPSAGHSKAGEER